MSIVIVASLVYAMQFEGDSTVMLLIVSEGETETFSRI